MAVIPSEYQEVEYVTAVKCDVDLNYVPKTAPKIVFTIMLVNGTDSDVAGFQSNTAPSFILDAAPAQSRWYNRYGSTNSVNYGTNNAVPLLNVIQSWEFGKYVKLDGETVYTNTDVDWSANEKSMHLFAARNEHHGLRLYNCSFYDGDQLIRKLIPCYRKSDNIAGLYDTVSESFFTSAVGTLTASSDATRESLSMLWIRRKLMTIAGTVFKIFKRTISNVSGIVSFVTNLAVQTKVTVDFTPTQDLHGSYPHPAGAGKNLFDKSVHTLTKQYKINSTTGEPGGFTNTQRGYVDYVEIKPNTTYTLSDVGTETEAPYGIAFYDENKQYISGAAKGSGNKYTFTTPANAKYFRATLFSSTTLDTLQLELGSEATSYDPYENICPIEGWAGCKITKTKENMLGGTALKDAILNAYTTSSASENDVTYKFAAVDGKREIFSHFKPNTQYTLIATYSGYTYANMAFYYTDGTITSISNPGAASEKTTGVVTSTAGKTIDYIGAYGSSYQQVVMYCDECGLFEGVVTANDFVEYNSNTYSVNWATYSFEPTQSGTGDPSPSNIRPITPGLSITRDDSTTLDVYGGTLIMNNDGTSTIVSHWQSIVCDYDNFGLAKRTPSIETQNDIDYGRAYGYSVTHMRIGTIASQATAFSDKIKLMPNRNVPIGIDFAAYVVANSGSSFFDFYIKASELEDITTDDKVQQSIVKWLSDNQVQFVVKNLESDTPITYTLSATETQRALTALGETSKIVYGGTLTINEDGTGTLFKSFNSLNLANLNWKDDGGVRFWDGAPADLKGVVNQGYAINGYCDNYKVIPYQTLNATNPHYTLGLRPSGRRIFVVLDETVAVQPTGMLVYEMEDAYKTTTSLTASQVKSFVGTNIMWHDMNGGIEVDYYEATEHDYDVVIIPVNPDENGKGVFAETRINLTAGDVLTIEYTGITDRSSGRILADGYYARTTEGGESRQILTCSLLTSDSGTRVLTATQDGYVQIGGSRNDAEGKLTAIQCKTIRIKITKQ